MKKLFIILIIFVFINANSQNFSTHKAVFEGLNNYMEFIHQSTHCLFLMHNDLHDFNGALLQKIDYPKFQFSFEKRDYLNNHRYYFLTPLETYDICINTSMPITQIQKDSLDKHLYRLKYLLEMLNITFDSIDGYVNDSIFASDSAFTKGFSYLNASSIYMDDFLSEWKLTVDYIESIAAKYEVVDMQNPYIRTAKVMDSLFDVVYLIAESVRLNDTNLVRQLLPKLEYQITKLDGQEEFYLDGAISYGRSNGKDPFNRYDNIIFDAKAQLAHTKNFLKRSRYPHYLEKKYGKPYYYYNRKFINKFNRHGIGMGYEFNDYADNSDNLVLKKAQIPHTYIVVFPPEPEPQDLQQATNDVDSIKYNLTNAPANNMIFLLDVSSSMNHPSKLPLLKDAMKFLITLMRDYDNISILTYSGSAKIITENISASNIDSLNSAIDNLKSGGSTKLTPGIKLAYRTANKNYITDGNNRIILATDGALKINSTIKRITTRNADKITLSVFYFNQHNYKFDELENLSILGNGNCLKITNDNIKTAIVNEAKGGANN